MPAAGRSGALVVRHARALLAGAGTPASACRQLASAPRGRSGSGSAGPDAASPTAAAQAAMAAAKPGAEAPTAARQGAPVGGGGAGAGADAAGSGGSGGGGWMVPLLLLSGAGGAYYVYAGQQQPQRGQQPASGAQQAALELLAKGREALSSLLPPQLGGGSGTGPARPAPKPATASGGSSGGGDKLAAQKQLDARDSGFELLPPGAEAGAREAAAAARSAADAAAAASAAARDAMSAPADEFPGSSPGSSTSAGGAPAQEAAGSSGPRVEHIDMGPITALFSEVSQTGLPGAGPSSSSSAGSQEPPSPAGAGASASSAPGAAAPPAAAAPKAAALEAAAPPALHAGELAREVDDAEIDKLCRRLGLSKDLAPAGLVAAANAAGLGPVSSSGTPLQPQLAQLNQATADARLLGEVLGHMAAVKAQLAQELQAAQQEKQWAEQAAHQREVALTDSFKELMREQSRIQQQLTEQAVRDAELAVMADTAQAQLQERLERAALLDALRTQLNELTLAFDRRTAQVKSAHEVHIISLGVLALSRALEEGRPIESQLQHLAAGCPGDAVVASVAASLPAEAASAGLPTLQQLRQRFSVVAQQAAEAAYFSGEREGGVLAHLAAKLAAKLKVDAGPAAGSEVDRRLSQARALLQQGKLLAAAEALSAAADGTHATGVVQQWVADARTRAVADQGVQLLQAYATATAAAAAKA